jgi:outer membrane protein assembly factor BamA
MHYICGFESKSIMMRISRIVYVAFLLMMAAPMWAQQSGADVMVDYNSPKKYIIGGVKVEGTEHVSQQQIIQISGLQEGLEVTVPSDDMSAIVKRLWLQRMFEDVSLSIDSIAPSRDTAFFKIKVIERPRVSRWTFSGVKSGEEKELRERLNFRRALVRIIDPRKILRNGRCALICARLGGDFHRHSHIPFFPLFLAASMING